MDKSPILLRIYDVALLTESVDWNSAQKAAKKITERSLSSRRAWIEMAKSKLIMTYVKSRSPHGERGLKFADWQKIEDDYYVALLTESVDWNRILPDCTVIAWWVALLTESVDWNLSYIISEFVSIGRSPHGERGLK